MNGSSLRYTKRWRTGIPESRNRGRLGAPAEVVLRLLILKHVRNWNYHVVPRKM